MHFFFVNLLITIVIELCINSYVVRRFWHEGPSDKRVLFANLISNPIAQIIYRSIVVNLWVMEIGVVIFETFFFLKRKKQLGKAFITSLVLNAASVLVGIIVMAFINTHALALLVQCKTLSINNTCVIENADTATELSQLAELRKMNFVFGDFRNYGLSLHRLGSIYYENSISYTQLETLCPPLMKDGCVHGYVMQYIHHEGIPAGIKLCNSTEIVRVRYGCMHALGHSYLETNITPFADAVKNFCGAWNGSEYQACVSGLFHEYTKGGEGTNHDDYYTRAREYVPLPCNTFTGRVLDLCYAAEGSFRQYFPDSEPLKTTYEFCDTAPTADAKSICRTEAYERTMLSKGYSVVIK